VRRLPSAKIAQYYGPLRQRIEALPEQRADDEIRGIQRELDLRAAHPDDYSYVAFVLRRS